MGQERERERIVASGFGVRLFRLPDDGTLIEQAVAAIRDRYMAAFEELHQWLKQQLPR